MIMVFMKLGSLFVEFSMSWVYGYGPETKSFHNFPYSYKLTKALNTNSLKCCFPSTDAIDRPENIHAWSEGSKSSHATTDATSI